MKIFLWLALLTLTVACQQAQVKTTANPQLAPPFARFLWDAENKASPFGKKVLTTAREMVLAQEVVVIGGCWDYANAVYNRAGFRSSQRQVILKNRKNNPLVNLKLIQPGDFLSYLNHSYNGSEHSAIFVDWLDFDKKQGVMVSYPGQRRQEPARYQVYDLSDVYAILRPRSP